ncbi:Rpp14/Pop5 family protein [Candidatus Bathyarchaeota archaeon]|nr:Rpp14/Pop5 family protein [Candidatus Bathyarchaeota archaeon]
MPVRNVRRRYLDICVRCDSDIAEHDLFEAILKEIRFLYGVKGDSEANFRMIEYSPEESHGIIRCSHNRLTEMRAAVAHVTEINGLPASIQVVAVSGTIKSLKKKRVID